MKLDPESRWAEPSLEQSQVESRVPSPGLKRARARADPSQAEMNLVRSASRSEMSRAQNINPSQYPGRTEFNRSRVEPSQASYKAKLSPSSEPWPKPSPSPIRSEPARHESSPYRYSSWDESSPECRPTEPSPQAPKPSPNHLTYHLLLQLTTHNTGFSSCDAYPTNHHYPNLSPFWRLWTL